MRSVNGLHLLQKLNAAMVHALQVFIYPTVTSFNNRAETLGNNKIDWNVGCFSQRVYLT